MKQTLNSSKVFGLIVFARQPGTFMQHHSTDHVYVYYMSTRQQNTCKCAYVSHLCTLKHSIKKMSTKHFA